MVEACVKKMYGETLDILAGKSFNGKFTAKSDLTIGYF